MCVCFNMVSLLGGKRTLDHAQIGLLHGFYSKFFTSIPAPIICQSPSPGGNISTQHCWAQHVARVCIGHHIATCWYMLGHVGCCWLKFETGQISHTTFAGVAWCCSRLARFVQQYCAWACALVRFSISNISQQGGEAAICCVQMLRSFGRSLQMMGQQCWDMLCWNVACSL